MLKVTQLVNGSIIYSNSIFSNSKTYILRPVVLKLENTSESPEGLLNTNCWASPPEFLIQSVFGEA